MTDVERPNGDRILFSLAATNGGAVGRTAALKKGVTPSLIHRRTKAGLLIPVTSKVYLVEELRDPRSVLFALCTAYESGAVSHRTAASLAGLPVRENPHHFLFPHGARPDPSLHPLLSDLVVHETRSLPEVDVSNYFGLRCTSVARTLCDLAPTEARNFVLHLVETALSNGLLKDEDLVSCLSARKRRGVRGLRQFAVDLAEVLRDEPYPESVFEAELLSGLRAVGLIGLVPQFRPPWYEGIRGITDIGHPLSDSIIEADGRGFRQVTEAHDNDRRRDRQATANGFVVIRVGYREFHRSPQRICLEIKEICERRAADKQRGSGS